MASLYKEFKNFAIKGNMIDMAVGIIIGAAFNNVVNTIVKKIVMPPLSYMTHGISFSDQKYILQAANGDIKEIAIEYGELIEVFVDFVVIAITIFIVIKFINKFKDKAEDPTNEEEVTPKDIELLAKIETLMLEQNEILKSK